MRIPVVSASISSCLRFRPSFLVSLALLVCIPMLTLSCAKAQTGESKHLLIYTIDVEGGQSTLLVSPSGASMLVDTGWPGNNARDAVRIQAAMKDAGITQIDHVLITHFHTDHVGGVPELVKRVKVGEFLTMVPTAKTPTSRVTTLPPISSHRRHASPHCPSGRHHRHPGLKVVVLVADGEHIAAVPGIKPEPNPYCATERAWPSTQRNARSNGVLVTFGKFRIP